MQHGRVLKWRRQQGDHRDIEFTPEAGAALPTSASCRKWQAPVWDQGQLGSCVEHGTLGAVALCQIKQGNPSPQMLSRLFAYWNARAIEGSTGQDSGSTIRDGIKSLANYGAPLEVHWPYNIGVFTHKPPTTAYQEAKSDLITNYMAVGQDLDSMRACIVAGFPIIIGFECFPGLMDSVTASTGYVPMPKAGQKPIGGHCVLVDTYDDDLKKFEFRNSWSSRWGRYGYGSFDYSYLTNKQLAGDFWTIRQAPIT